MWVYKYKCDVSSATIDEGMPRLDELLLSVFDVLTSVTDHLSVYGAVRLGSTCKRLHESICTSSVIMSSAMVRSFPSMSTDTDCSGRCVIYILREWNSPDVVHEYEIISSMRIGISEWLSKYHTLEEQVAEMVSNLSSFKRREGRQKIIRVAMQWKDILTSERSGLDDYAHERWILDSVIERAKSCFFLVGLSIEGLEPEY